MDNSRVGHKLIAAVIISVLIALLVGAVGLYVTIFGDPATADTYFSTYRASELLFDVIWVAFIIGSLLSGRLTNRLGLPKRVRTILIVATFVMFGLVVLFRTGSSREALFVFALVIAAGMILGGVIMLFAKQPDPEES